MPTREKEDRFSLPLCVFQLVAAPLWGFLGGLIATELFDQVSGTRDNQFASWLCYALAGFGQGFMIQAAFRRAASSGGRFVWIPPGALLAYFVFLERGRTLEVLFRDFLFVDPYSFERGGLSAYITMPAFASCCYVLGVIAAHRSLNAR